MQLYTDQASGHVNAVMPQRPRQSRHRSLHLLTVPNSSQCSFSVATSEVASVGIQVRLLTGATRQDQMLRFSSESEEPTYPSFPSESYFTDRLIMRFKTSMTISYEQVNRTAAGGKLWLSLTSESVHVDDAPMSRLLLQNLSNKN